MINVEICSGSQCMMGGASSMHELLEELIEEQRENGNEIEIKLGFTKCMKYCKEDSSQTPIVKINDEVIKKATTQEVMERIMELIN